MITKVVLAIGSRRLEVEGAADFVDLKLKEFRSLIERGTQDEASIGENLSEEESPDSNSPEAPGKISLKRFMAEKAPKNTYQAIACVLFYARKYRNSDEQSVTEIRNGLIHGKFRPPTEI